MERLLPGFSADLIDHGAVGGDVSSDVAYLLPSGWAPRFKAGLQFLGASRTLIEWVLRKRLMAMDRVSIVEGVRVAGLSCDGRGAVRGVRLTNTVSERELEADFIVDASGRSSRAPDWLKGLGHRCANDLVVDSSVAYVSRRYRRPDRPRDWTALFILADPRTNPRYGGIFPEEGGRWAVGLAGAAGLVPPTDEAGFMAFAADLRSPVLHEALAEAEPLEPVVAFRNTMNRMRPFHRMRRWPDNFVVVGDAVAAMNPIYGQGMTLAGLAAQTLSVVLAVGNPAGSAQTFQRRLAAAFRIPWLLATSQDSRHGSNAPLLTRLTRAYTDRLQVRIPGDPVVADAFYRVVQFDDPRAMIRRRVLARALMPARSAPHLSAANVPSTMTFMGKKRGFS